MRARTHTHTHTHTHKTPWHKIHIKYPSFYHLCLWSYMYIIVKSHMIIFVNFDVYLYCPILLFGNQIRIPFHNGRLWGILFVSCIFMLCKFNFDKQCCYYSHYSFVNNICMTVYLCLYLIDFLCILCYVILHFVWTVQISSLRTN